MIRRCLVTFSLLTLLLTFVSCGGGSKQSSRAGDKSNSPSARSLPSADNPQQHDTTPVIRFEAFDVSGKSHSSDEWIGKQPLVLNFWGSWCPPCRREVPDLVRLYREYAPKGIEMIGLAVKDRPEKVKTFSKKYGMQWTMLMADRDILVKFGVISGVPQTIFLDKSGREVKRFIGARPYETLKEGFETLLQGSSKPQ